MDYCNIGFGLLHHSEPKKVHHLIGDAYYNAADKRVDFTASVLASDLYTKLLKDPIGWKLGFGGIWYPVKSVCPCLLTCGGVVVSADIDLLRLETVTKINSLPERRRADSGSAVAASSPPAYDPTFGVWDTDPPAHSYNCLG